MGCYSDRTTLKAKPRRVETGDLLFWVSQCPLREPHYVSVVSVGRRWIRLSNGVNVDKSTMRPGLGATVTGQAYTDQEAYAAHLRMLRLRSALTKAFASNTVPDADVLRVCELLGIDA